VAVNPKIGELIEYELDQWERLKSLALDSVTSPHSKRAYESALISSLVSLRIPAASLEGCRERLQDTTRRGSAFLIHD
jgi:hypothetical protein